MPQPTVSIAISGSASGVFPLAHERLRDHQLLPGKRGMLHGGSCITEDDCQLHCVLHLAPLACDALGRPFIPKLIFASGCECGKQFPSLGWTIERVASPERGLNHYDFAFPSTLKSSISEHLRSRVNVSGVVTPSPVGPAMENDK